MKQVSVKYHYKNLQCGWRSFSADVMMIVLVICIIKGVTAISVKNYLEPQPKLSIQLRETGQAVTRIHAQMPYKV